MFNDRDLGVLGAGALLTVFCLVLPLPFIGKVGLGLCILIGFMALAVLRLGPDRVPLEVWVLRRIRFYLQARRYTYQQSGYSQKRARRWGKLRPRSEIQETEKQGPLAARTPASCRPIDFALEEVGIYPLATVLLAVVGVYALVWLEQGGAEEIASLIGGLSR